MAEKFVSKADQAAIDAGKPLPKTGTLTPEDYKAMIEMALAEAVEESPAKDMISKTQIMDMKGQYAGLTSSDIGPDGKRTGTYSVSVDWGKNMERRCQDERDGMAYAAQRFSTVFHEVRHVEQKALLNGDLDPSSKLDMELVTQMTVNDLYPSVYERGYRNTISEVDADVEGLEGALAFFDRHPEIKERYGFDFRKEILRTDEYDLMDDKKQVDGTGTIDELLESMKAFRAEQYEAGWTEDKGPTINASSNQTLSATAISYGAKTNSEGVLMENLVLNHGVSFEDLEGMSNDERNVLLIDNAKEVIEDPDKRIASNLEEYKDGVVMTTRCDEYVLLMNQMEEQDELNLESVYGFGKTSGMDGVTAINSYKLGLYRFVYQNRVNGPGTNPGPFTKDIYVTGQPAQAPLYDAQEAVKSKPSGTRGKQGKPKSKYLGFGDIAALAPQEPGDPEYQ